jgi:type II secretory pathway pseudopilin PulG
MRRRRKNESGFILLVVLLMAAIIAISLYKEIPRVAFESQRQKELLLIERGEQYKRAIQLFYRDQKRLPAKLEDLENTNNKRYLRKRYTDPMTGKDEWRVIKSVNGVLVDSKVQKPQNAQEKQGGSTSTYIGEVAGLGQTLPNQSGQRTVNPGLQRRGSDTPVGGAPGGTGDPNAGPGLPPGMTGPPGAGGPPGATGIAGFPGGTIPGQPPGLPQQPGIPPIPGLPGQSGVVAGGPGATGLPGAPGRTGMPGATGTAGQQQSGSSYLGSGGSYLGGGTIATAPTPAPGPGAFPPGNPANSQNFGGQPAYPTNPGAVGQPPGFGQPGLNTNNPQAQNAAANMIGQLLTQPRPGGMPQTNSAGIGVGGTGIAGFASTADQDSIIIYNDQTNYGLWEFVFDPSKQKAITNPNGGTVGTPVNQMGQQNGQPAGTPMNQPFGTGPGTPPKQ